MSDAAGGFAAGDIRQGRIVETLWVSDWWASWGSGCEKAKTPRLLVRLQHQALLLLEGRGRLVAAAINDARRVAGRSVAPIGVPVLDLRQCEYRERRRLRNREGIGLRWGLVIREID